MIYVLEDCERFELTTEERDAAIRRDEIYQCDECSKITEESVYHIPDDVLGEEPMRTIEQILYPKEQP